MTTEKFGQFLKRKRNELDLTQELMAEKIGIGLRSYQYLEYNQSQPEYKTLHNLVHNLKIDPAEIFGMPSRIVLPKSNAKLAEAFSELEKENEDLKLALELEKKRFKELSESNRAAGKLNHVRRK